MTAGKGCHLEREPNSYAIKSYTHYIGRFLWKGNPPVDHASSITLIKGFRCEKWFKEVSAFQYNRQGHISSIDPILLPIKCPSVHILNKLGNLTHT